MEHEADFNKYTVVVLTNNKEIIVKNPSPYDFIDIINNAPYLGCTGILNNSLVYLYIRSTNIIYIRDLFESEKRIVRQIEDSSK